MKLTSRTERSRALILDAAEIIFREEGFDGATVEAIATRAGLTRKTAYNLFGSKEEIAHALIEIPGSKKLPLITSQSLLEARLNIYGASCGIPDSNVIEMSSECCPLGRSFLAEKNRALNIQRRGGT